MLTRGLNFDTLPTCDSHRYYAVIYLSTFRYSNTENVKNKTPNGLKHSHSNLEHEEQEEHTQKSEKLQEVEPKNNIQHKPKPQQQNSNLTSKLKSKKLKKKKKNSQPNPQQNPNLTTKLKSKKIIANQSPHQKPQPPPTANRSISKVTPADSVDSNPN